MRVIGPITEVYGPARLGMKRRVEKPNSSSGLGQETRPRSGAIMLNAVIDEGTHPCRFGTASPSTDFDNAIPAPFIAQIIGQILETKRSDSASAMRAFKASSEWRMANSPSSRRHSLLV